MCVVLFSYLTVQFTDVGPRHQTLPEFLGSVPDQIEAGLLQEEGQEAQVAVQILEHNSSSLVLKILHRPKPPLVIIRIIYLFSYGLKLLINYQQRNTVVA